jgi:tetratricopeptide (TPR) repeat protein
MLSASVALAQAETSLTVKCVDQSGQPVKDVRVVLQPLQPPQGAPPKPLEGKSNKQGLADFKKIMPGFYRVIGRKQGLDPSYREPIRIAAGKGETATLNFAPGDMTKKLYFEDPAQMQQANRLFQEGLAAYQQQKFPEAAAKLSESLKIIPSNSEGYFWLGISLIQQAKWDEGKKAVEAAIAINPTESKYQEIIKMLPGLRLGAEGQEAMQKRDFKTAIVKFSEQAKLQPEVSETYYNLALSYANDGQYDKGMEAIEEALKRKPNDPGYTELKNLIPQHKEQALRQQAGQLLREGDDFFNKRDYQAALQKYEAGRLMLPKEEAVVWYAIGRCHAQLKHPEETIAAYQRAVALNPKKPEYVQSLALLLMEQKRVKEALQAYETLYQQLAEPVDEKLFELGKKLIGDSNPEGMTVLQRVVEVNPNHAESYYEMGVYTFYSPDKEKSKPFLTKYVEIGKDQKHLEDAKAFLALLNPPAKPGAKTPVKPKPKPKP